MLNIEFVVMSRKEALTYSQQSNDKSSIVISITDPDNTNNDIVCNKKNNIKDILFLKFEDALEDGQHIVMTLEDALKIKKFVEKWIINNKNLPEKLIVHCDGGVSRSSGICAALAYILTGSDMFIWENYKYSPNIHCYSKVLEIFGFKNFETEMRTKEALNAEIWLKYFEENY